MAKNLTLTQLANLQNEGTAVNNININSAALETALSDVLSLSGEQPNQMKSNLDMNNFQIINASNFIGGGVKPQDISLTSPFVYLSSSLFNGVTNVATAINSAQATLSSTGGGTVVMPPGVGLLNASPVLQGYNNVTLIGAGRGATILRVINGTTNVNLISLDTVTNARLADFTFDHNNQTNIGAVIIQGNSSHCSVNRVSFINQSVNLGYSVILNVCNYATVQNCDMTAFSYANTECEGIIGYNTATNSNCLITNNVLKGIATEICMQNSVFSNNIITGWGYGSAIANVNSALCFGNIITNNFCSTGLGGAGGLDINGFFLNGIEAYGDNSIISNNIVQQVTSNCIWNSGNHCVVSGNYCFDPGYGFSNTASCLKSGTNLEVLGSPRTAKNNIIIGNIGGNFGGSGAQYGYSDDPAVSAGIITGPNSFTNVGTSKYHVVGTTTIVGPSS